MHAYIVTLITAQKLRLRARVLAPTLADACRTGRRCAIEAGYTPTGMWARSAGRPACRA